jgi:hypothetical protein
MIHCAGSRSLSSSRRARVFTTGPKDLVISVVGLNG